MPNVRKKDRRENEGGCAEGKILHLDKISSVFEVRVSGAAIALEKQWSYLSSFFSFFAVVRDDSPLANTAVSCTLLSRKK